MNYIIKEYVEYNAEEILSLYHAVGWSNYYNYPQMLQNAYQHSLKVLGAYVEDTLVAIIRVVGDSYSVIFIQDLLVLPEYQGCGIGTALLQEILKTYKHVYQIHLLTENTEKTIQFYKSQGFTLDRDLQCCAFSKYAPVKEIKNEC
ncbi:MAG: GNAT family N-acetyltransferase [Eubacteriales bacterium]|nr:GNAT family N-acetyltransferase [Eubacteriales bacterium]